MFVPDDYYDAARWLQNSKRVADRGIQRSMYAGYYRASLIRRSPDSIAAHVGWLQRDVLTYYSDGTAVLEVQPRQGYHYNPLFSQGMRHFVTRLTGFSNVFQHKHKIYIMERDYKLTPSKIQGCRSCRSSGLMDTTCYPDYCWDGHNKAVCPTHPDEIPNSNGNHIVPCEHKYTKAHTLYRSKQCWSCNGKGRREYGLKPISLMWDGSPIRIKGGNLVKREPSELEKRIAAYVSPLD